MTRKEILCPYCNHKPFRNDSGLAWHVEHQHGKLVGTKEANQTMMTEPTSQKETASPKKEEPLMMTLPVEKAADKTGAVENQEQSEKTAPDVTRHSSATMTDFERLLNSPVPLKREPEKKDEGNLNLELSKFEREIEDKIDARVQIFTERDAWLSERITELEEALKSHILR
jgi:hypothetical protein